MCKALNHLNVLYAHLDILFKSYALTKLYVVFLNFSFALLILKCLIIIIFNPIIIVAVVII